MKPSSPWARRTVLLIALIYPSIATWLYFVVFSDSSQGKAVYVVVKSIQFALPVLWVLIFEGTFGRWRAPVGGGSSEGQLPSRGLSMAAGLPFGMAVAALMHGLYWAGLKDMEWLASAAEPVRSKVFSFGVNSLERFAALATFYCLVHSFLEEYYWRWFVYRRLRADMPVTAALIVSGVGFMGHHVIVLGQFFHGYGLVTWLFSAAVAVGGAAWALLYERSRSLLGIWLSHVLVDAGIMLIGWDLIFR